MVQKPLAPLTVISNDHWNWIGLFFLEDESPPATAAKKIWRKKMHDERLMEKLVREDIPSAEVPLSHCPAWAWTHLPSESILSSDCLPSSPELLSLEMPRERKLPGAWKNLHVT